MERESNWLSAGRAQELALIRFVCELQIAFFQTHARYPSPAEIQREYHRLDGAAEPTPP